MVTFVGLLFFWIAGLQCFLRMQIRKASLETRRCLLQFNEDERRKRVTYDAGKFKKVPVFVT